jgi:hypothetical protein
VLVSVDGVVLNWPFVSSIRPGLPANLSRLKDARRNEPSTSRVRSRFASSAPDATPLTAESSRQLKMPGAHAPGSGIKALVNNQHHHVWQSHSDDWERCRTASRFWRRTAKRLRDIRCARRPAAGSHNHRGFPNVPSASLETVLSAYIDDGKPAYIWDFGPQGFKLVGGRFERLPDGTLVSYIWFRGEKSGISACSDRHSDLHPHQSLIENTIIYSFIDTGASAFA